MKNLYQNCEAYLQLRCTQKSERSVGSDGTQVVNETVLNWRNVAPVIVEIWLVYQAASTRGRFLIISEIITSIQIPDIFFL
jgi:hypothetical protein